MRRPLQFLRNGGALLVMPPALMAQGGSIAPDMAAFLTPKDNPTTAARVELGRRLFEDKRLSADNTVACATCHDPKAGFTARIATAKGIRDQIGRRNSPTVLNAMFLDTQFWDGRAPTLEEQAKLPILNPIEMGVKQPSDLVAKLAGMAEYAAEFQKVFGRKVNYDDVGRAIAAFERTVVSGEAPIKMMVGEHDWFLDMGEVWRDFFGPATYSFDHKGVHFVVLMSVMEKDFWTARGLTPEQRMQTVAGLDNSAQSAFEVGAEQRQWLQKDLAKVDKKTPLVVFSHSPLYKYYRPWNFWTDDADEVQAILRPFETVTVIHGHTHQVLSNRIGNISFHGVLSTAWPWPYAPEGLPKLTVEMSRANPFDPQDACGDGRVTVSADGLADMVYNLWDRNPMTVPASYLKSMGRVDRPPAPTFKTY